MSLPNLNLLNFELPQSKYCKYVLTSPRSLKACRKAGIKPVDLLYRSLKDVEKENGKDGAQEKYQAYEKERQKKLGVCRKIRNELLIRGLRSKKIKEKNEKETKKCEIKEEKINDEKTKEKVLPELLSKSFLDIDKKSQECQENLKNAEKALKLEIDLNNEKSLVKSEEKLPKFEKKFPRPFSALELTKEVSGFVYQKEEKESKMESNLDIDSIQDSIEKLDFKSFTPKEKISRNTLPEIIKKSEPFEDLNNNHDVKRSQSRCESRRKKEKRKTKRQIENAKMDYSNPEYCLFKYKQVIENSIDREIREQDVKRVQRQIEEGMERWQDRVLLLQWLDLERAQEQVAKALEVKVERLQQMQRSKEILHTMNINRVREEEDLKAEFLRREIENKNRKILILQQEKERVICESKDRAHSVAEIREQVRNIMTPETFDKKIMKYGFEKKVLTPPGMCPRLMQCSHIRLG